MITFLAILTVVVFLVGAYFIGKLCVGDEPSDNLFTKTGFGIMVFGALYAVFVFCYLIFDLVTRFLTN